LEEHAASIFRIVCGDGRIALHRPKRAGKFATILDLSSYISNQNGICNAT
jgi:hypothetical protein